MTGLMLIHPNAKAELLALLRAKSVFHGDFKLSSGARSHYYIDCRTTTLDPKGLWLVGQLMHQLIREQEAKLGVKINAVGGLTLGADPISIAVGMFSFWKEEAPPLQPFTVRKTPKSYGQTKLIEGNFRQGDMVVVIDDVVTKGESTLKAIDAVTKEGGKVAFVVVLVDRQEGGRKAIEEKGHTVLSLFTRDELLAKGEPQKPGNLVSA
jgi:orotate phosphoribosyltransferase